MEMVIRYPNYAGSFYPKDKTSVLEMFSSFISDISSNERKIYKDPFAIIVPHAGYVYSGKCAMYAYDAIKDCNFDIAIVIGRSHRSIFDYAVLDSCNTIKTPIGDIRRGEDVAKYLLETCTIFKESKKEHDVDHSLEVQMPFISYINENYNKKNIGIVSILLGNDSIDISNEIKSIIDRFNELRILIICSTDLSHFYNYESAKKLDDNFKRLLVDFDIDGLNKASISKNADSKAEACAMVSVINTINIAKKCGRDSIDILNMCNSYDSQLYNSNDKNRVVGYMSAIIY